MSGTHGYLAYELRDGVLQDLVAIGLLIEAARTALSSGVSAAEVVTRRRLGARQDRIDLRGGHPGTQGGTRRLDQEADRDEVLEDAVA